MYAVKRYQRNRAVEYARRWALSRNPLFEDFGDLGGNCTNFVSQCILAGSCVMNFTPTYGWYYRSAEDRAPAWTGVDALYRFLIGDPTFEEQNGGIGPYAVEVEEAAAEPGDVIQLAREDGTYYHSLLLTGKQGTELLVSAHSRDALDRPLSTYFYFSKRILHIVGVRLFVPEESCYDALLEGVSLSLDGVEDF
jgi:hypothetical protein